MKWLKSMLSTPKASYFFYIYFTKIVLYYIRMNQRTNQHNKSRRKCHTLIHNFYLILLECNAFEDCILQLKEAATILFTTIYFWDMYVPCFFLIVIILVSLSILASFSIRIAIPCLFCHSRYTFQFICINGLHCVQDLCKSLV